MFPNAFLQQESLTLNFVALGIGILGMSLGRFKGKDYLWLHRWAMTGATVLNLVAVLSVMLPSMFNFYINPVVNMISFFSILQIIHGIIAWPAVTLSVIFAFNDLPSRTKKWMRITAVFWVTSIILGGIVYFTMPN